MADQAPAKLRRSWIRAVFISRDEDRLRAAWRLLLQVFLQISLTACAGYGLLAIPGAIAYAADLGSGPGLAVAEVVQVATVTLSVVLARRLLDHRSFISLGLRPDGRALRDLAAGIGITAAMMGLIFIAAWALGWLTLDRFAWATDSPGTVAINTMGYLLLFLLVGWNEELMSRGYHLQTIASGLNPSWGLVLSSAFFGLLHLGNPHATWISAAGIFFAGMFLGYAFLRSRQLWLSIGLHIGWNFFEGVAFGFPVSGLDTYHLARITVVGSTPWMGGPFGPEAGLIILPAITVGLALVHLYTRNQQNA